jgi:hypothetical protein
MMHHSWYQRLWSILAVFCLLATFTLTFSPSAHAQAGGVSARPHQAASTLVTYCQSANPCNPPLYPDGNSGTKYPSNPVMHHPKVYLIFWGKWSASDPIFTQLVALFNDLAGSANNNILTQYYDATDYIHNDVSLAAAVLDTNSSQGQPDQYSSLDYGNIINEAHAAVQEFSWQITPDSLFMVIPDAGAPQVIVPLGVDACGYHSYDLSHPITWAWVSAASSCLPTAATAFHEYAEAATDPQGDGSGWVTSFNPLSITSSYAEIGDLCSQTSTFLVDYYGNPLMDPTGVYLDVQPLWDNAANTCSNTENYQWANYFNGTTGKYDALPSAVFSTVGINRDGSLEAFARSYLGSGTNIWHSIQTAPNSRVWTSWLQLQMGSTFAGKAAVGRDQDGRLEIFARGMDNNIWHIWQTSPGGPWYTWQYLQQGSSFQGDPVVVENRDGRLEVFARGWDNNIWHIWQTKPNSGWGTWQYMEQGSSFSGDPAAGMDLDGRLEVFAVGSDSKLWVNYQLTPGGSWSNWVQVQSGATGFVGKPAVGRNADGRLEVFARKSTDNNLYHSYQLATGGTTWASWSVLQSGVSFIGTPAVGLNYDGRLEVFARGSDNNIWHIWQTKPNSGWSGWNYMEQGSFFVDDPAVAMNQDGRLEVFAYGSGNVMWHNWQVSPGGAALGWSNWVRLP